MASIFLTNLDVQRDNQYLKFSHVDKYQQNQGLWCTLRFLTYEQLVVFFCIFLALRCQDTGAPMFAIEDWKLAREEIRFECNILENEYEHHLMLLRDKDSGGVRILASVAHGEVKHMPVWTAFITHQIHSPTWMKRTGRETVSLKDLHRYVFENEYKLPTTGAGDLVFDDREGRF